MKNNKTKKSSRSNLLLILIFLVGLSLLLYPTVADWWNSFHASRAISTYDESIARMSTAEFDALRQEASDWNAALGARNAGFAALTDAERAQYETILNVTDTGLMGYIDIPTIRVKLPIYHGTSDSVLQVAVGHIDSSSLPIGGESTHCVLSGHRGLPSARLFTDIDRLEEGDLFLLHTLDETLTYEVDQILTVLPEDVSALGITAGEDLCTLVTCTPYGVNTHRLLVRGHRVATDDTDSRVISEARRFEPITVMPFVAAPLLLALLIWLLVSSGKKRNRKGDSQ